MVSVYGVTITYHSHLPLVATQRKWAESTMHPARNNRQKTGRTFRSLHRRHYKIRRIINIILHQPASGIYKEISDIADNQIHHVESTCFLLGAKTSRLVYPISAALDEHR